jgi:hypothetical protein
MSISRRQSIASLSGILTLVGLSLSAGLFAAVHHTELVPPPPPADPNLIVPGASVGRVSINEASKFLGWLGEPRNSHGVNGHNWLYYPTVVGGFTIIGVYTVKGDTGEMTFVHQVWTNSPTFRTATGDCVGSPLSQILRDFPNARPMSLAGQNAAAGTVLYDDPQLGISFQIIHTPRLKCSAILVHRPGQDATAESMPLPLSTRWDLSIP